MSAVYAKDGSRAEAGDRLFALDGRDAIAEPGTVRFFRPLSVGDRGDDVLQLKQILAASGDNPGPMNTVFTEQTRFALAQWQAQHHYPGATPVSPQIGDGVAGAGDGVHARRADGGGTDHRPGAVRRRPRRHTGRRAPRRAHRVPRRDAVAARDADADDPVDERGGLGGNAGDVRDHRVGRAHAPT